MKNKPLIILTLIPLLLTSCSKNKNAIYVTNNADLQANSTNLFFDVTGEQLTYMMQCSESFILYEYSPSCSSCKSVSENFETYLAKNSYTFYRYAPSFSSDYIILNNYDDEHFPASIVTPRVIIISEGKVVDEIVIGKLTQYKFFNSAIDSYTKLNSHVYSCHTLKGLNYLEEKNNDLNVILYNSETKDNIDAYHEAFNNTSYKAPTSVAIDKIFADEDLLTYLLRR